MSLGRVRSLFATVCSLLICSTARLLAEEPEEMETAFQNNFERYVVKKGMLDDVHYLHRIQSSAYYYPVAVTGSGDNVQLHDASLWFVHPYQRHMVKKWVQSDPIFIKPNAACCSTYRYVLQNRVTQDVVEVNLIGDPIYTGAYTRWIVQIDYYNRLVYLNDNTIWYINPGNSSFNKWRVQDRLIIGVNNNWRFNTYPHVLINVSMSNVPYCEASIGY